MLNEKVAEVKINRCRVKYFWKARKQIGVALIENENNFVLLLN